MKLPKWLRVLSWRRDDDDDYESTVTVTLTADVSGFIDGIKRARDASDRLHVDVLNDALRRLTQKIRLLQVGVESRMYIRGALSPDYATPDARDAYVRELARLPVFADAAVAAFLRGWVERDPDTPPEHPVHWHRYIGDTRIVVSPA